jgi:superfamily I DNA/RNA helicase/RecB family exonuclease
MTNPAVLRRRAGPEFRLVQPAAEVRAPVRWDETQRRVIEHDRGVLRVIGGPGSGKSALLIEAVAARVESGVPLGDILVLTFAAAAASTMRDQITRRLGRVVTEPLARTVHSYAFGVLRQAAMATGAPTPRLLASAERDLILREILAGRTEAGRDRWPAELAAARDTRAFVEELQDVLTRACEQGISARELRALGRQHKRPEWIEAASVFSEYLDVTALQSPGAFDAPELIQRAIGALTEDTRLLAAERRRRRRVFIDEFSDLDPVQVRLISLLTTGADEVVLTGDPDQSIFSFRGSDPYALADAGESLGTEMETVLLPRTYRGSTELLTATRRIADRLPGQANHRRLDAAAENLVSSYKVRVFASEAIEASQIARTLRRAHLEDGIGWQQMAVLMRSTTGNYDILRRQLALAGVPVGATASGALPQEPLVVLLVALLRRLLDPASLSDDEVEALLCSAIGQADPLQVQAFRRRLRIAGYPVATLTTMLEEPGLVALAGPRLESAVHAVQRILRAGREKSDAPVQEILWALWSASGLAMRLEQRSAAGGPDGARADRDLDAALDLFAQASELSRRSPGGTVPALISWLEQLQIADRPDPRRRGGLARDAVEILSAHAAKGRQWDVVCVAGVQDGHWPSNRVRASLLGADDLVDLSSGRAFDTTDRGRERLAAERRLFYVAITRARRELLVSAVSNPDAAASRFLDELDPLPANASRPIHRPERALDLTGLLGELRAAAADPLAPAEHREAAAVELARLAAARVAGANPLHWWGFLETSVLTPARDPELQLRISPSHLQTYLDCELRALLQDLAATDARDVVEASVGTLVHQIAEDSDDDADLAELERLADDAWSELEFVAAWQRRTERARASAMLGKLAQWLDERRGRMTLLGKEEPFRLVIGDVVLSGRIDRLERTEDGGLVVIDLKATKRDFTKADVEGHTQLAVYQMAVAAGQFEAGDRPAGALLVHLGKKTKTSPELRQRPLPEQEDPDRIVAELARLSADLRQPWLHATPNEGCEFCPVQACCPTQDDGRQVIGPDR